jgi:ribokinase
MVRIVVLASFNMDLVMRAPRRPEAGETLRGEFSMHLGGKGFNQAVAARRLGADVTVIGRVGDDEFGRMFLAALDDEGIDRRAVSVDPRDGTGVASIIVEPDGTNTIVQAPRANLNTTAEQVERAVGDTDATFDAALFQLELSDVAVEAFVDRCSKDVQSLVFNPATIVPFDRALLRAVDVVVANETEARRILGNDVRPTFDPLTAPAGIASLGAQTAVVTVGRRGAAAVSNNASFHSPAFKIDAVDTTGAGDAFCAAFVVRQAEGAGLADALRFANAAGALACTTFGAYESMPHRAAVEALLAEGTPR